MTFSMVVVVAARGAASGVASPSDMVAAVAARIGQGGQHGEPRVEGGAAAGQG